MSISMQDFSQSSGYHNHQGLAVLKKSLESAAFLIHLTNPSNMLSLFFLLSINYALFFEF